MIKAFVIGHPIKHSRSPLIHGYWLKHYGLQGSYEPIEVTPEALPAFLDRLRGGEFAGGNVTVPHKEQTFQLVDEKDPKTAHIKAFNTLVRREDGHIFGTNTDLYGFLANLDQEAPGWSGGLEDVVVLGAGGAARAVVAGLTGRVSGKVHVLNRTVERAQALIADFGDKVVAAPLEQFGAAAQRARLIVNTTTIGMHGTRFEGIDLARVPRAALVTDIVYVPLLTPLLTEAAEQGLRVVDGLGMLLHQAVPGFEAWFGTRPEVTPELRVLIEATLK